jgi:lipopolysaccharide exporter
MLRAERTQLLGSCKVHQTAVTTAKTGDSSLAHIAWPALKWRFAGTAFQVGLRFFIGVVLARLLSPEAFGIVGLALIPIGLGRLLGDLGFGAAIIQRAYVTREHVRAAFTGSVTMGMLLFSALWFLAPTVSHMFMQDALTPILRAIGVSFILSAASATPICLLRRELRFRMLAGIEIVTYVAGYGTVGVLLAVWGFGAWSLVAANIAQSLCEATLAIYLTKQPVWLYFGFKEYRNLFGFASAEVLNNVVNYIAENLDFFVTGKWLGPYMLGLYNRSFYLTTLPVLRFSAALSSVIFPLYSKIQGDIPRLGRALLCTVLITSIVTTPVFFAIAAAPEIFISGLFGERWRPAAGPLQILCLSGPLMATTQILGAITHARGYVFNECARQIIYLISMAMALWLLLPYGIEGVAMAVALATFARYLLLTELALKLAEISWREFSLAQVPGGLLGIIVAAIVFLVSRLGGIMEVSDTLQLLIIVAISLFSLIGSFLLFPSSWFREFYPWVNERFGMNLPYWLRRIIVVKISSKQKT